VLASSPTGVQSRNINTGYIELRDGLNRRDGDARFKKANDVVKCIDPGGSKRIGEQLSVVETDL
jgi:hypothetical protein